MAYFISGFLAILALAGGAFYYITNTATQPAPAPVVQQVVEQPKPQPSISIDSPTPNEQLHGEIEVLGKAKGNWFFEGSFPIALTDSTGAEVASGIATAAEEWMTENYVPFIGTLDIGSVEPGTYTLTLKKDNPSDLPENDESTSIPVSIAAE